MTVRLLTGVTPSGTLHLGNYVGCIRPAILKSQAPDTESFYFLSDYHALIKCADPARIERSRLQIAATWLACGLDPQRVHFYRQSDLPETLELCWMINCVTSKGLMNRAHAYKAKVEANVNVGEDPDNDVSMGLFCYPILMAADILIFSANFVPVGRDQIQHIEMCRDIAIRFNQMYGGGKDILTLPEALIDEEVAVLPGLDGRKMSKSYDNVIPLFEGGEKALKNAIYKIVTDSKVPGEPKDPDSTSLTAIYEAFANHEDKQSFRDQLKSGLGWGEAKEIVFDKVNAEIGPMRTKYEEYMGEPDVVEKILQEGVERIRPMAKALVQEAKHAVGLRTFRVQAQEQKKSKKTKTVSPVLKQYRDTDGLFYFKLIDSDGKLLLTSGKLASGKEVGKLLGQFKTQGIQALGSVFCQIEEGVTEKQIEAVRLALISD